jgi:pentatricopeptide repeat protein
VAGLILRERKILLWLAESGWIRQPNVHVLSYSVKPCSTIYDMFTFALKLSWRQNSIGIDTRQPFRACRQGDRLCPTAFYLLSIRFSPHGIMTSTNVDRGTHVAPIRWSSEESRRCASSTHAGTTASPLPNETKAALSFLFKPLSPRIILARLKSFGKGGQWNEAWKIVQEMELWDG